MLKERICRFQALPDREHIVVGGKGRKLPEPHGKMTGSREENDIQSLNAAEPPVKYRHSHSER